MAENTDDDPIDATPEEMELGAVLVELIERARNGEHPRLAEYLARYPHLHSGIRSHFELLELVEDLPARKSSEPSLARVLATLSDAAQEIILLRNFRGLRWSEIARRVSRAEEDVRREYVQALSLVLEQCGDG